MAGPMRHVGARSLHHGSSHPLEVHDDVLTEDGNFDSHWWELKFDAEFDKYDVSEHQMILAARDVNGTYITRPYSISI